MSLPVAIATYGFKENKASIGNSVAALIISYFLIVLIISNFQFFFQSQNFIHSGYFLPSNSIVLLGSLDFFGLFSIKRSALVEFFLNVDAK